MLQGDFFFFYPYEEGGIVRLVRVCAIGCRCICVFVPVSQLGGKRCGQVLIVLRGGRVLSFSEAVKRVVAVVAVDVA